MSIFEINITNNPKAKAFANKLAKHKAQKMEELRLAGLTFLEKSGKSTN